MSELKYKELTEQIIGAVMMVHAALGNGFQEVIYQRALAYELFDSDISYKREFTMPVYYKGGRWVSAGLTSWWTARSV